MVDIALVLTVLLTVVVVFYSMSVLFWLFETTVLATWRRPEEPSFDWGLDDIQVRISTVSNAEVVEATVESLPDGLTDVHVIAEEPIDVPGATVHAVPDSFTCEASHKGRALEWARRNVHCRKEYILFLDEDTLATEFSGLPDADVIQFTELPLHTGSRWSSLCEVFRVGYQYEQRAFSRFRFPLYVWGGGIAIRRSVEDRVTWNRKSITEDTAFVWTAAARFGVSLAVLDTRFRNQAPPTLRGLVRQRRRWMSGTRKDGHMLPLRYRLFVGMRALIWAVSPLVVVIGGVSLAVPDATILAGAYTEWLVGAMLVFLHFITAVGASLYGYGLRRTAFVVVLTIPIVVLNTVGALWGFLSPTQSFTVTPKVAYDEVEVLSAPPAAAPDSVSVDASEATGATGAPNAPDALDASLTDVSAGEARTDKVTAKEPAAKETTTDGPATVAPEKRS